MIGDYGMKISTGGLALAAEQIVEFGDGLIVLGSGAVAAYRYSPESETGFIISTKWDLVKAKIDAKSFTFLDDEIVEIAGNSTTLKIRYSSGTAVKVEEPYRGFFIITKIGDNVARITANADYLFENQYYRSGVGTAPLVPLLKLDDDEDIVTVFEGVGDDRIIKLSDLTTEKIVGSVAGLPVIQNDDGYSVYGNSIDGFGTIKLGVLANSAIKLGRTVASNAPRAIDHSDSFAPAHYAYITAYREDWRAEWAGFGKTGHVVNTGDTVYMQVIPPAVGSDTNDIISFVMVSGEMKRIDETGNLTDIDTRTESGLDLVDYIYNNDMTNKIALKDPNMVEAENFSLNGFFFSYGADHWEEVDLNDSPPI